MITAQTRQEIEKDVDTIERHIVDAFTGGEPTLFPAPPLKASWAPHVIADHNKWVRSPVAHKTADGTTFRFEPSAIDGRYTISIETGTHPYVKFGAVLTRREVQALIECLSLGLRDSAEEDENSGWSTRNMAGESSVRNWGATLFPHHPMSILITAKSGEPRMA
jgi:hypothetical protein